MSKNQIKGSQNTCTFCEIAARKIKCYEVFSDEVSLAFLDRRPVFQGHCLLLPVAHCETFIDLPPELIAPLFSNARLLAAAVESGLKADETLIAINNRISQSIPHLHIHIVPRRHDDGLRGFFWPRTRYNTEESAIEARDAIVSALSKLNIE